MKVIITNLKAHWPAGAELGDVVDVGEAIPGCLVGKCRPAGEDAEAAHRYEPVLPTPVLADAALAGQADGSALAQAQAEIDALRAKLAAVTAERDALAAAGEPSESRAALEAEANALGVSFRSHIGDETLAQRIAEAKAAKS